MDLGKGRGGGEVVQGGSTPFRIRRFDEKEYLSSFKGVSSILTVLGGGAVLGGTGFDFGILRLPRIHCFFGIRRFPGVSFRTL